MLDEPRRGERFFRHSAAYSLFELNPPLSAVLHDAPGHGAVTVNADGSFTYKPEAGFVGVDEFRYQVIDPSTNDLPSSSYYHPELGIVRIYVTPVAPPLAVRDSYAVQQDQSLTASTSVLSNDIGAGRPLSATLVSGPAHGSPTHPAHPRRFPARPRYRPSRRTTRRRASIRA